jgi:hypothetical protein
MFFVSFLADAEKAFNLLNGVNETQQGVVTRADLVTGIVIKYRQYVFTIFMFNSFAIVVHETFKDRKALYRTLMSRESLAGLLRRIIAIA